MWTRFSKKKKKTSSPSKERRLKHIAFIMDGNGRWAEARGLPRLEGHRRGVETLRVTVEKAVDMKIPYVSFYAFSTENWRRSEEEINGLMNLFKQFLANEVDKLAKKGVRIRFAGNHRPEGALSQDIVKLMRQAEEKTAENTAVTACFMINYGGRDEITRAVQMLATKAQDGALKPSEISEDIIGHHLDTPDIPDPDLCIRTSGEQRLSNFMPWQLAYAELMFVEPYWPDFDENTLEQAVLAYQNRERRFGGRKAV